MELQSGTVKADNPTRFIIGPVRLEEHDDLLRDITVCGRILAPARVDDPLREQVFLMFSEDVGVLARAFEPLVPALQCSVELRALDAREELSANDSLGPKSVAVTIRDGTREQNKQ
eukprot:6936458-Prymnesium_polylepis.1